MALLLGSLLLRDAFFRETLRYSVQGIGLFLTIGSLLFSDALGILRQVLSSSIARFVGRLSYSLYLYHWGVIAGALQWHFGQVDPLAPAQAAWLREMLPLVALLSLVLASLSYYGIERPVMTLRRRWGSHALVDATTELAHQPTPIVQS